MYQPEQYPESAPQKKPRTMKLTRHSCPQYPHVLRVKPFEAYGCTVHILYDTKYHEIMRMYSVTPDGKRKYWDPSASYSASTPQGAFMLEAHRSLDEQLPKDLRMRALGKKLVTHAMRRIRKGTYEAVQAPPSSISEHTFTVLGHTIRAKYNVKTHVLESFSAMSQHASLFDPEKIWDRKNPKGSYPFSAYFLATVQMNLQNAIGEKGRAAAHIHTIKKNILRNARGAA